MNTKEALLRHQTKAQQRINLVPSEHAMPLPYRLPYLSDVLARYYFPSSTSQTWAFPGNEELSVIYKNCERQLQALTGAKFINLKPISGVSSMTIALAGLLDPGDTVMTVDPQHGGHTITHGVAAKLGLTNVLLPYQFTHRTFDADAVREVCATKAVKLVYIDQCHALFPIDPTALRAAVSSDIPIYYDASHIMGLIFGDVLPNPLSVGVEYLGGSTHKTMPGPHKGFIATNNAPGAYALHGAASDLVSHDHPADTAALALLLDDMEGNWSSYAQQVVKNASTFARALHEHGFRVLGAEHGFTQTHQVWFEVPGLAAYDAVIKLASHDIITNTFKAPGSNQELSIRVGVQELTTRGATEQTMQVLAKIFKTILLDKVPDVSGELQGIVATLTPVSGPKELEEALARLGSTSR